MKKLVSGAVAIVMAAALLGGCVPYAGANSSLNKVAGTASGESQANADATRLMLGGSQAEQSQLKDMGNAFKDKYAEKNYEVAPTILGAVDVKTTVAKGVDTLPDVFAFSAEDLPDLVKSGALLSVSDAGAVKETNTAGSMEAATVDGMLYGYPSSLSTYVLYYNKNLLTVEDIKSVEGILAKEASGVQTNFSMDFTEGYYSSSFFLANGCSLYGANGLDPVGCDFNQEAGLEAAKAFMQVATNPKAAALKDDDLKDAFRKGTLAAAVSGTWNADSFSSALGGNYGVAMLPTVEIGGEDKQMVSLGNLTLYGVKATTKYPEAAQELALWLTNKGNQLSRAESGNVFPTNAELLADSSLKDMPMVLAQAQQGGYMKAQPVLAQVKNFQEPLRTFGNGILDKSITEANLADNLNTLNAGLNVGRE